MSPSDITFLGIYLKDYIIIFGSSFILLYLITKFKEFFASKLHSLVSSTTSTIDDEVLAAMKKTSISFKLLSLLYFSTTLFGWFISKDLFDTLFFKLLTVIYLTYVIVYTISITITVFEKLHSSAKKANSLKAISIIIYFIVGIVTFFSLLGVLGVNPTSLLASAGVTAIVLGFALQNVLGDVFNNLTLAFDQPFEVGDTIKLGTETGVVQKVGFKTTRIKLLHGEEMVITNSELLKQKIYNLTKLTERRVEFNFYFDVSTDVKKIISLKKKITTIVEEQKDCVFYSANIYDVTTFGLRYDIVFFYNSTDYLEYLYAREGILSSIVSEFSKHKLELRQSSVLKVDMSQL
jgi:small-conductance mechanosensitive channel